MLAKAVGAELFGRMRGKISHAAAGGEAHVKVKMKVEKVHAAVHMEVKMLKRFNSRALLEDENSKSARWPYPAQEEFAVGSEDKNDIGQRIKWKTHDKHGHYISVGQELAVDAVGEIKIDKTLADNIQCNLQLETAYRSAPGKLSWLQSRLKFICVTRLRIVHRRC